MGSYGRLGDKGGAASNCHTQGNRPALPYSLLSVTAATNWHVKVKTFTLVPQNLTGNALVDSLFKGYFVKMSFFSFF